MRCNFGCCHGFFGIGVGRVPRNLSCMLNTRSNNCCNCCCNSNRQSDYDHHSDCDDFSDNDCCEFNNRNRSC